MKNLDQLIDEIIPPHTGWEREAPSNDSILSNLNESEKAQVEKRLLERLEIEPDFIIAETLTKLNVKEATVHINYWLNSSNIPSEKIKWASFIFQLNGRDVKMEEIAFTEFTQFNFKYEVEFTIFYDLIKFESERINNLIRNYTNHKYFLVAYHAKKVLGIK